MRMFLSAQLLLLKVVIIVAVSLTIVIGAAYLLTEAPWVGVVIVWGALTLLALGAENIGER